MHLPSCSGGQDSYNHVAKKASKEELRQYMPTGLTTRADLRGIQKNNIFTRKLRIN